MREWRLIGPSSARPAVQLIRQFHIGMAVVLPEGT